MKKYFVKKYTKFYFDELVNKNIENINLKKKAKFYIIASKKRRGFFSLILFVLNHLKFSKKKGLIPIIDMEIYKTIYNEKKKINKSYNAWEYYFYKINNYNINQIYQSNNYILANDNNIYTKDNKFNKNLNDIFLKNIKLRKNIKKKIIFYKTKLNIKTKNKILGIHFRGTDMRISPNHPTPPFYLQMINKIQFCKNKYNINKIFLVTEDLNNYNFLKKKFGKDIISINNFRSNKTKVFSQGIRSHHRYKMGEEALINSYLLSSCSVVVSSQTGISDFAKFINPNLNLIKINNGFNSSRILISFFEWRIKNFLFNLRKFLF